MLLARRSLLAGATTLAAAASLPRLTLAADSQKTLRLQTRQIEVGGKAATRYRVIQPSGAFGLTLDEGDELDFVVENALPAPSGLHWHGLTEPWRLDGVPYLSAPPIAPGGAVSYRFPAIPTGMRFMHSHFRAAGTGPPGRTADHPREECRRQRRAGDRPLSRGFLLDQFADPLRQPAQAERRRHGHVDECRARPQRCCLRRLSRQRPDAR